MNDFKKTGKHLGEITCASLGKSYDTLARIYGYMDYHHLQRVAKTSNYIGPYDDEHESFWLSEEGKALGAKRLTRAVAIIIADCPWLVINSPGPAPYFIESLKLFSNREVQRDAFYNLNIPKTSSKERREVRELELEMLES
jgi:hypothetical protein